MRMGCMDQIQLPRPQILVMFKKSGCLLANLLRVPFFWIHPTRLSGMPSQGGNFFQRPGAENDDQLRLPESGIPEEMAAECHEISENTRTTPFAN